MDDNNHLETLLFAFRNMYFNSSLLQFFKGKLFHKMQKLNSLSEILWDLQRLFVSLVFYKRLASIVSFVSYHQRRFIGTCETNDQKFMPLQYIVVNIVMQLVQTFCGIAFELFTFFNFFCSIKSLDIHSL